MSEQASFNAADESLLEAALSQSFTTSPGQDSALVPELPRSGQDTELLTAAAPSSEPLVTSEELDAWKSDYDSQVEAWRAESAEAREKAEKERKRWEDIREKEALEATHTSESSWEKVGNKATESVSTSIASSLHTPSVADSRDLVSGEPQSTRPGTSHSHVGDDAGKWEDVPSISSSFPSMTFPEHEGEDTHFAVRKPPAEAPISATLAIFDSSLSTRTRVKALFSSLAINFLLPFVNGVMLGFGEIFAKNIVLEWWRPGSTAAQTGIRGTTRRRRP